MDGSSNAAEYLVGTGMNDSNDVFRVGTSRTSGVPEVVVAETNILTDRIYILEEKASLITSSWLAVGAASGTAEAGSGDYAFPMPTNAPDSYFRVRVEWE